MKRITFGFFFGFFFSILLYLLVIRNQEKVLEIAKNFPYPLELDKIGPFNKSKN